MPTNSKAGWTDTDSISILHEELQVVTTFLSHDFISPVIGICFEPEGCTRTSLVEPMMEIYICGLTLSPSISQALQSMELSSIEGSDGLEALSHLSLVCKYPRHFISTGPIIDSLLAQKRQQVWVKSKLGSEPPSKKF